MKIVPIALIAFFAWVSAQAQDLSEKEKQLVKNVEKVGGTFAWVTEKDKQVFCLDIDNKSKTLDFQLIGGIGSLQVLRVFQGRINEKSLIHLPKLTNLELLVITSEGLTDTGMKSIGKMKRLAKIDVKSDAITGKGLLELQKLKSLRRLFLYNTTITDSDLEGLCKLPWLDELCVPFSVTDAGLAQLKASLTKTSVRKI